jgi:hypothetical protein
LDLFLVISQGVGLAVACGVRPFPSALVAGVFAAGDLGLDFDGTDYSFLESAPFLVALGVALVAWWLLVERRPPLQALSVVAAAIAVVLGALEFAGSLADEGHSSAAGLVAGAVVALLGWAAAAAFLGGARARLDTRGVSPTLLIASGDIAAACLAAIAIALPPLSYLALAFCAWVLIERRRRAGEKYEGLRILR